MNASGRCIFHSINLKLLKRPDCLFVIKFCFSCLLPVGGKRLCQNKMLRNVSILTGKTYVVQIYQIKLPTKNQVDWTKNEVLREVKVCCTT